MAIQGHPEEDRILRDLAAGESVRAVAARYGLSKSEVDRYAQTPRPRQLLECAGARTPAERRRK